MFERFTDRARRVIVLAQEEARALQHNYIGTEHLLLGLIREGEGVAAKALASKGVELDATRKQVEEMIGKGNAAPNGHIPFTPHAKQVLEFSLREALQLGHSYIGTEHILLGLIREGEGVGTQVLIKMDVDLGELRSATIDMIRGNSGTGTGDGKGDLANAGGVTDKQNKSGSAILDQFGRNLTAEAAEGKLDPVIGRTNEIERVMVVLSRRTKNNPVLIGEPGVGKTAVVEGLAQKIQAGDVPETLKGKQVYSLDLGSMVAGSRYRGDFEERLKKVLKEIKTRGDIVLFIDEIHTIVGAGSADGALGASDMLKPMLARGELQTIGATTTDEYRKYIEKDAALERRFQPIQVHEPTIAETIEILKGLRSRYENHHHVTITDGALQSAAELSSRYIQDRNLPDKAIDLIDEAGARLRIKRLTAPPELKELDEKIAKIAADKDEAIKGQDFEKAAELRDKQEKLEADRKQKEDSWREGESDVKMVVDEDVIAEVISSTTGIPVFKLTQAESKKLLNMEAELHKRIIGQNKAIEALSKSIRRTRAGREAEVAGLIEDAVHVFRTFGRDVAHLAVMERPCGKRVNVFEAVVRTEEVDRIDEYACVRTVDALHGVARLLDGGDVAPGHGFDVEGETVGMGDFAEFGEVVAEAVVVGIVPGDKHLRGAEAGAGFKEGFPVDRARVGLDAQNFDVEHLDARGAQVCFDFPDHRRVADQDRKSVV